MTLLWLLFLHFPSKKCKQNDTTECVMCLVSLSSNMRWLSSSMSYLSLIIVSLTIISQFPSPLSSSLRTKDDNSYVMYGDLWKWQDIFLYKNTVITYDEKRRKYLNKTKLYKMFIWNGKESKELYNWRKRTSKRSAFNHITINFA
jgi:hypothetical protein